jgi:hypothetical protein
MNNHCKIYVSFSKSLKSIRDKIYKNFSTKIVSTEIQIYFNDNEDYNKKEMYNFPDGFLYFEYTIDIEMKELEKQNVSILNDILNWFWNNNIPAIASCDYENQLTNLGGYKNESLPFPSKRKKRFWFY